MLTGASEQAFGVFKQDDAAALANNLSNGAFQALFFTVR
jgi:hypothetical protein